MEMVCSTRESTENDPRPGKPSTSTDDTHVQKIKNLVHANALSDYQKTLKRG